MKQKNKQLQAAQLPAIQEKKLKLLGHTVISSNNAKEKEKLIVKKKNN